MSPKEWQEKIRIEDLSKIMINLKPNPKHWRQDQAFLQSKARKETTLTY